MLILYIKFWYNCITKFLWVHGMIQLVILRYEVQRIVHPYTRNENFIKWWKIHKISRDNKLSCYHLNSKPCSIVIRFKHVFCHIKCFIYPIKNVFHMLRCRISFGTRNSRNKLRFSYHAISTFFASIFVTGVRNKFCCNEPTILGSFKIIIYLPSNIIFIALWKYL